MEVEDMAAYSVYTKLSPEEALKKAVAYFGGELGLELVDENACCVSFVGGGGHITVTARSEEKRTVVDLETREWDYHVKQFMRRVG